MIYFGPEAATLQPTHPPTTHHHHQPAPLLPRHYCRIVGLLHSRANGCCASLADGLNGARDVRALRPLKKCPRFARAAAAAQEQLSRFRGGDGGVGGGVSIVSATTHCSA
eukprot:gene12426-biopygen4517